MLKNDKILRTAKGHLKVEVLNEQNEVVNTIEKNNLIVNSAYRIMAETLANPNKMVVANFKKTANTSSSSDEEKGYYIQLDHSEARKHVSTLQFQEENEQKTVNLNLGSHVQTIIKAEIEKDDEDITELDVGKDVWLTNARTGEIAFEVAPVGEVRLTVLLKQAKGLTITRGVITATVKGDKFSPAEKASDTDKTFKVDYETGRVFFETPKTSVLVEYELMIPYGINFMALGGIPTPEWEKGRPVEFKDSDKKNLVMQNEIADSRVLVSFPEKISEAANEIDSGVKTIPIKQAEVQQMLTVTPGAEDLGTELIYDLKNKHDSGSGETPRLLEKIISIKNVNKENNDITDKATIVKNDITGIQLRFDNGHFDTSDVLEVKYVLRLSNNHLIHKLSQSPLVKLVSVRHISSLDATDAREYLIENDGLEPNKGDVWISNSNTAHVTFSNEPVGRDPLKPAPPVHEDGLLYFEYKVNSGSSVQFTAEFPKGTPEMVIEEDELRKVLLIGEASVLLPSDIHIKPNGKADIISVTVEGEIVTSGDYTLEEDNGSILLSAAAAGNEVVIKYRKEVSTFDIYQVAMFDEQVGGKMFNITGIGPIPKDKNSGIRVTWTVVF